MNGTIKFWNKIKHFGFIIGEDGEEYYFPEKEFMSSMSMLDGIRTGDACSFEPKHHQAIEVFLDKKFVGKIK